MNWKKFFIAFIAAFIFIFIFGFFWFGKFMDAAHKEVPVLWRAEADFGTHFPWLVLGDIIMAFFLTTLYARFVAMGGAGTGFIFGILVALMFDGNNLIAFTVHPLTSKILGGWIVGDLIMFGVAGAIIGAIYKPGSAHVTLVKERPY